MTKKAFKGERKHKQYIPPFAVGVVNQSSHQIKQTTYWKGNNAMIVITDADKDPDFDRQNTLMPNTRPQMGSGATPIVEGLENSVREEVIPTPAPVRAEDIEAVRNNPRLMAAVDTALEGGAPPEGTGL